MNIVLDSRVNNCLIVNVLAKVDDLVAVVFKQYLYDVLADVMDISLYGSKNDFSL